MLRSSRRSAGVRPGAGPVGGARSGRAPTGRWETIVAGAPRWWGAGGRIVTDRTGLRLMAVHAHPDDESSKGAATTARYAARGRGRPRGQLHRGRARQRAQPELPARGAPRRDGRGASRGDGGRGGGARRAPALAGVRRLRAAGGRPAAAAARRVLRAHSARGRGGPAGGAGPVLPAARDDHLRPDRRLPAPGPHHGPPGGVRGLPRGRRPGAVPRSRPALGPAQALLQPRLLAAADADRARGAPRRRAATRRSATGSRVARSARCPSGR